ncbi:MAG: putative rane protein, partial [Verrucomicrobiota bacterium]
AQEVEDGNIAAKRGQSPAVKKIGMRMVADHSKGTKELIALAKKKGFTISTSTVKPRNFDSGNFDKQYLASMQQDHEQDIKAYQKEAQSGDDPEVKAWAAKNLPTLKEHLAMVKSANHK